MLASVLVLNIIHIFVMLTKPGQFPVKVTLRTGDRFGKPNVLAKQVCKRCVISKIHNEMSLFHNSTFNKFTFTIQINITHKTQKM